MEFAGWRLLEHLGIHPEVCHLNEGHAAFAVLERAAAYIKATGTSFSVAMAVTRAGNLFTTHTPVEAGFDRFPVELVRIHLHRYCAESLGISFESLMALGQSNSPTIRANHSTWPIWPFEGVARSTV